MLRKTITVLASMPTCQAQVADILSERDVAVALTQNGDVLREATVSENMTVDVGFCSPKMSVEQFIVIIVTSGIPHLPVLNGNKLRRIFWLRDVSGNWVGGIVKNADALVLMTDTA